MKNKYKQIINFNPQPAQYWRIRLKKKSIKKKNIKNNLSQSTKPMTHNLKEKNKKNNMI